MFCIHCGKMIAEDSIFCGYCGIEQKPAKKICPSCKKEMEMDLLYCRFCGTKLDQEEKKEIVESKESVKPAEQELFEDIEEPKIFAEHEKIDLTYVQDENQEVVKEEVSEQSTTKEDDVLRMIREMEASLSKRTAYNRNISTGTVQKTTAIKQETITEIKQEAVIERKPQQENRTALPVKEMKPTDGYHQMMASAKNIALYKGEVSVGMTKAVGVLSVYSDRIEYKKSYSGASMLTTVSWAVSASKSKNEEATVFTYNQIRRISEGKYMGMCTSMILELQNGEKYTFASSVDLNGAPLRNCINIAKRYVG